jgi:hypothetical protein
VPGGAAGHVDKVAFGRRRQDSLKDTGAEHQYRRCELQQATPDESLVHPLTYFIDSKL